VTPYKTEDHCYQTVDGIDLMGRLYRPEMDGPIPFVVEAHGGAWSSGDRMNNAHIHQQFASSGIGVFALDFRLADQAAFPAPVIDINSGVRWFKANAKNLRVTPSVTGGLGSSSGGQQMGLVALLPNDPLYRSDDPALADVDASLDFFIGCWPILDPLARHQMARANGKERLVSATNTYFSSDAAMRTGNPFLVVERGDATHLPPVVIIQGTEDDNVEHGRADLFAKIYRAAGGNVDLHKYEGQPHNFIKADIDADASKSAIEKLKTFILAQT
jgi:acetyl esterase